MFGGDNGSRCKKDDTKIVQYFVGAKSDLDTFAPNPRRLVESESQASKLARVEWVGKLICYSMSDYQTSLLVRRLLSKFAQKMRREIRS